MRFHNPILRARALHLPFLLAAALAAGCSSDDDTPGPQVPTQNEGHGYDVERYDLKGEFDWSRERLVATVGITLAPTEDGVQTITLDSVIDTIKAVRVTGGDELPYEVDLP